MRSLRLSPTLAAAALLLALCVPALVAHAQEAPPPLPLLSSEDAFLSGFDENPPLVSPGSGFFSATVGADAISYQLVYSDTTTAVTQAHIHLGNPGTNGPIIVFLCSNAGVPADFPTDAQPPQACPAAGTPLTGTIMTNDVLPATVPPADPAGTARVLLAAGDLEGLKGLIFAGSVYANVHSEQHPPGELRGQINPRAR